MWGLSASPSYRVVSARLTRLYVCIFEVVRTLMYKAQQFYLGGLFMEQGKRDYGHLSPNPMYLLAPHENRGPQRWRAPSKVIQ